MWEEQEESSRWGWAVVLAGLGGHRARGLEPASPASEGLGCSPDCRHQRWLRAALGFSALARLVPGAETRGPPGEPGPCRAWPVLTVAAARPRSRGDPRHQARLSTLEI